VSGRSDELDEAAFLAGEAVADMLAWSGMDQAIAGDQVVAHARRLLPPAGSLSGHGDTVRSGDLVAEVFVEGGTRHNAGLVILNLYDAATGNVNCVCPDRYGYGIRSEQLAGAGRRREYRLIEPAPPDWRPHSNRTLTDDDTVSTLDARFAQAGQPGPTSMVDVPTLAWAKTPSGARHAVPAGTTLACCKVRMPRAPDTAPVFAAGAPGTCRRCSAQAAAAARAVAAPAHPAASPAPTARSGTNCTRTASASSSSRPVDPRSDQPAPATPSSAHNQHLKSQWHKPPHAHHPRSPQLADVGCIRDGVPGDLGGSRSRAATRPP
jgi:hypothetical protein